MPKPTAQTSDEQSASGDPPAYRDPPASRDLPVSSDLQETLRWATGRLREIYGSRLKRLILFGSQARGDAGPESDVDVLVVLSGPVTSMEEAERTSRVAIQAAARRDTALSFIHKSEEEYSDERRPLVQSVKKEGVDLLEAFPPPGSAPPKVPTLLEDTAQDSARDEPAGRT